MRSTWITGAAIAVLVFAFQSARADVLVLKSGERKTGLVKELKSDPGNVEFTDSTGVIKIPRARISKIEYEPEFMSHMHIGQQYLDKNNLLDARRHFTLARNAAPDNPEVLAALDKVERAIQQKQADEQKRKEELMELELKNVKELLADKQFEKAADKTRFLIGVAPTEEQKAMLTRQLGDVYYQWGLDCLDRLDRVNAPIYLSKAYELNPSNVDAFNRLLALWEKDPARTNDVIKVYQDRLRQNPNDLEVLFKLSNLLLDQNNYSEALPMLVTLYNSEQYRNTDVGEKLKKAYETVCRDLVSNKNYLAAADLYEQYVGTFPGTDPTPIYLYEYADKLTKIDPNRVEDYLELGDFAKDKGLLEQAKKAYKAALDLASDNKKALQELTIFAQRDLREAQLAAQRANYLVAINIAEDVKSEYAYLPEIVQQADDLIAKADIEYKRDLREKREQAQELIRKADEYFNVGVYHMNAMKNVERTDSRRPVSDKLEAISNFELALRYYRTALKIDPSSTRVENGDVSNKIQRTQAHLSSLTNPVPLPMPGGGSPSGKKYYPR